ncbi:DUF2953 domain-containing protein [Romboutsia ilealis]|uniref:DUF2953 domain-containing protein n=1 Tax=Romboutsia faecis TaxID=2764597 RepID=A0ABR7JMK6_9FIRM|nr:DUF2953 domain-containing protein [Romboutsia faecis]MBC5996134.1 DUF2953 domain-containing protein [Romboutsia faecis]MRN23334.1 DUF2953 domain-containing protein [Romboutsia ilealis]
MFNKISIKSIDNYYLENNTNMKHIEMFNLYFFIAITILVLFIIYKSRLNIIISIDIDNNTKLIKLNIKYLFNLLNIKIQLYPPKKSIVKKEEIKNKKEKEKSETRKIKLFSYEILRIYAVASNVQVKELYSNISFGNKNIYFTCFIYVFINTIYGNLSNLINAEKIYLNVEPNFLENYINGKVKIHISPKIEDLWKLAIAFIQNYRKNKDGDRNESNRVNTKPYGDNA